MQYSLSGAIAPSIDDCLDPQTMIDFIPSKKAIAIASILIVFQILDGVMTGVGMGVFGSSMEGNAAIRSLMQHIGCVPALFIVKSFAISTVIALTLLSTRIAWIPSAMKMLIAVYFFGAILPWGYILIPVVF